MGRSSGFREHTPDGTLAPLLLARSDMTTTAPPPCSVLILAGGRGARMGGHDKGLLEWQGYPLVRWVHDAVRALTDDLIISCNRHLPRYAELADQIVHDEVPDYPGPLAGVCAGLQAMRHEVLVLLPCDAPRIDHALVQALRQRAQQHPGLPVMVRQDGDWNPMFSVIPARLRPAIVQAWQAGERSPRRLLLALGAVALDCAADDPRLANFNTPAQLQTAAPRRDPE